MTILCTIEFRRVIIQHIDITMNNSIFSRNVTYLIFIVSSVDTNIIAKITSDLIIPVQSQFNTGIFHITTIDVWCTSTSCSQNRSLNQPVFGSLDIEISSQAQTASQETCINTDVSLF